MSVIQNIRDKYARIAVIAIAVALLGFILMDALTGKSSFFRSGPSSTVGRVNGTKINIDDFRKKEQEQENLYQQQGQQVDERMRENIISGLWSQEVNQILMTAELNKLGITTSTKEIESYFFGKNPPADLKQRFTDEKTGIYDATQAQQFINSIRRRGKPEEKAGIEQYFEQQKFQRSEDKYSSLLANSINYPKWMIEKRNTDNSLMAKVSFVRLPYTDSLLADSTIKISNEEIADYISKHKKDFKQEESRSIAYVSFSTLPSIADSAATKEHVLNLKPEFDSTKEIEKFLAREGTSTPYANRFAQAKDIQPASAKDSITRLPLNGVYGPYLDGGTYTLAKLVDTKQEPEMVKVRHILISTATRNPQNPMQMIPTKDTAVAKKQIDSIQAAIKNGSNFDTLCVKFSDDDPKSESKRPGSFNKVKGGIYDSVRAGAMVPEFNDFIFENPVGTKGVVKTEYGYHYVEILGRMGKTSTAYKIAYLAKAIETSRETDDNANNEANKFAGESRDQKSFDENFQKELAPKGISKLFATDIKKESYDIMGLGSSRPFIKKIYEASKGDVLQPERIGENYVVAIVTEVNKEGTQSVEKARFQVEPILKNQKKTELAKKKFGKFTTLEQAASAVGKQILTQDSLRISGASKGELRFEPSVIGAAFNSDNKGKVVTEVIPGINGVYAIRVDEVIATAVLNADVEAQRKGMYDQAKQGAPAPIEFLRKAASIKDYRSKFF